MDEELKKRISEAITELEVVIKYTTDKLIAGEPLTQKTNFPVKEREENNSKHWNEHHKYNSNNN